MRIAHLRRNNADVEWKAELLHIFAHPAHPALPVLKMPALGDLMLG